MSDRGKHPRPILGIALGLLAMAFALVWFVVVQTLVDMLQRSIGG